MPISAHWNAQKRLAGCYVSTVWMVEDSLLMHACSCASLGPPPVGLPPEAASCTTTDRRRDRPGKGNGSLPRDLPCQLPSSSTPTRSGRSLGEQ